MVAGLVIGARSLGWLNSPELWAYDHLMQWQRPLPLDPRILLITVTDDDIKTFDKPLKDETIHRLLQYFGQFFESKIRYLDKSYLCL
jgi:CHASE2 domain-containing sensor protein